MFALFTIFVLANFSARADQQPKPNALQSVKVQLNWHHQYQFAGFYAALQQGYYHQAGLKVELLPWRNNINPLDEVTSGRADFGVGVSSLITDFAKGSDIRLVMSAFQYSPLVLLSHKPISSLDALANTVVMHNGSIQIRMLLAKSGLAPNLQPREISSSGDLNDFISGKVDFYGAYLSNEPYQLEKLGVDYAILDPKNYGIQSYSGLIFTSGQLATKDPVMVKKFRDATIRGWAFAIKNPVEVTNYIVQNYPVNKSVTALIREASALKQYVQVGNIPIGDIDQPKINEILSTAQKLKLITPKEYQLALSKPIIFKPSSSVFNEEELAYIRAHKHFLVADLIDYPPFQFQQSNVTQGLIQDYLGKIEKIIGIPLVNQSSLPSSLASDSTAKENNVIYPAMTAIQANQESYLLSDAYLNFPMVLMGLNNSAGFIQDLHLLNGYTIAVRKNSFPHRYLHFHYPYIKLLLVDSIEDGLVQVQLHKAFAIADNLPALNYALNAFGYTNMQVIAQGIADFRFSMATTKENPILFSIINKALSQIDQSTRQEIYLKWLSQSNEFNYQRFWQVLTPLVILLAFMALLLAFNYRKQRYLSQIYELSYANMIDAKSMKINWTSDAFSKLSGYSKKELLNMPYLNLASDKIPHAQINEIYRQVIEKGKTWTGEIAAVRKDGEEYWVELTLMPSRNIFGKVTSVLATRVDISDRKKVEAISITDELTGLYNRRHFDDCLPNELKRASREEHGLCFVMLDLDYFKKINDDYGHQIGDEVLIEIATSINAYFNRANDFVFRIGGEEFFIITHFEKLRAFAVHLNNLLESVRCQKIENKNAPLGYLTISIGALYCSHDCLPNPQKILRYTDDLLYLSKKNGRNRSSFKVLQKALNSETKPTKEMLCEQYDFESFEDLMDSSYT
ncbi:diguanylate cyclase [Thiosulfatimonas sediminis]|uniref:diguanylate cyclase n=1 Tax=Thiosulfatimonas sediminis TaxID=2675054 RepID=UPI0015665F86|nr:diguanylate cyclase [Thiosulfatimonas sediminis]